MMKPWHSRTVVVSLFTLALLSACKGQEQKKAIAEQPVSNPLTGDFSSGCREEWATSSETDHLRFTATEVLQTHETHSGHGCNSLVSTYQLYSTYSLGSPRGDNVFNIDYREERIDVTPATEAVAADWNRQHYCGISDWVSNWPRTIDKLSGCVGDTMNQRPTFSVIEIRGNQVKLGVQADRNQDGLLPQNRYTGIGAEVFVRNGLAACPVLSGSYVCSTQGDATYAGKNVAIGSLDGRIFLKIGPDNAFTVQFFYPERPTQSTENSGFTISTQDSCQAGLLINHVESSRTGDSHNRSVTERTFKIGDNRALLIDTYLQDFQNDRPGRLDRVTTSCSRLE